ncbi:MAG TPA: class II aldolase/adducin family protein, partial [Candidatus Latescibacteria bacterium]|nr:class II aldolase/adducin family protein [Candidatus Latescibacterota bacterium]
ELVEYGRRIAEKGLVVGPGGNTSVRFGDVVYMKASGIAFEEAGETDYIGVDLRTGEVVDGDLKPTAEILMHLGCYRIRDDIGAVVHAHPPVATAVGMQGQTLKPFTPDFVAFVATDVPAIGYVVPGGRELAEAVGRVIKDYNGVLLGNHGLLTVGYNLKEAYYRTLLIEDACKTLIAARCLGRMRFFTPEEVKQVEGLKVEAYRRSLLRGDREKR